MTADVVVAPFTVEKESAAVLRSVADSCLERLVRALTARGITVARRPELSEKTLRSARPTPWAVLGHFKRNRLGMIEGELRLIQVETAEEMRSYSNADKNPEAVANLGEAAAGRIAAFVQEQTGARRPG